MSSESDAESANDWLNQPIKSRSYYNSRLSQTALLQQRSFPLFLNQVNPTSPALATLMPRRSLLPTPKPLLRHSTGVVPPSPTILSPRLSAGGDCFPIRPLVEVIGSTVPRSKLAALSAAAFRPYRRCLQISSQDVGAILGRAGSTVSRIERQYNVAIYLDRQRLQLIVRGRLEVQVNDALADFGRIITDNRNRGGWISTPQITRQSAINWRSTAFRSQWDILQGAAREHSSRESPRTYWESPEVAGLGASAVLTLRAVNHIYVVNNGYDGVGFRCPNPIWLFEQAFTQYGNNWAYLLIQRFAGPSAIQAQGWPILLQGHDLIGIAKSGSGKTLTYLLPALLQTARQMQRKPKSGAASTRVVVLVPSQDAAMQVDRELRNFSCGQIRSLVLVGGPRDRADNSAHWIIGLPSRITKLLETKELDLSNVRCLIVDGADHILELGLELHLYRIVQAIRVDRQTVAMSKRWNPQLQRVVNRISRRSLLVCIGPQPDFSERPFFMRRPAQPEAGRIP